jgi:hypothetical protein
VETNAGEHLATKNLVLAALPQGVYDRLLPDPEFVSMTVGEHLYKSGDIIEYVNSPGSARASPKKG